MYKSYKLLACLLIILWAAKPSLAQDVRLQGVVSDQYGPLSGASVSIPLANKVGTTNIDGSFIFELLPGTYTISVSALNFEDQLKTINLKSDTVVQVQLLPPPIEVGGKAEPIDVITAEEIERSSYTSLGQMLQYLVPSFHSTHQTISDGTDHIDPATLRGLGPDQILVLINGKRWHNSALLNVNGTVGRGSVSTDLNAIPTAAVDHVEILRDGAATRYGSDAIAGVINIILKEGDDNFHLKSQLGTTAEGDGTVKQVNANYGFKMGEKGFVHVAGEFTDRESVNRSGAYTGTAYGDERDQNLTEFFQNTGYDNNRVMEIGSAAARDAGVMMNASLPLNLNAELYAQGGFNYRIGLAAGFYRFPKNENRVVPELYAYGFSPRIRTDIADNHLTLGMRGERNGWQMDFSNTRGSNSFDFTIQNSNNASLGTSSPTAAYAGGFRYGQNVSNLDVSKGIRNSSVVDTASINFGMELRFEDYEILAGEEASWIQGSDTTSIGAPKSAGIQVFPGFQPQNALVGYRSNAAAYIGGEVEMLRALLLSGAIRYESYSDFGDNISWKLVGRYVYRGFTLRGTYSTGFRAPSLHQIYFSNISTQFVGGDAIQVGTFNNQHPVTKAFGISPLKPELSSNISLGLIFEPFEDKDLKLNLDVYQIGIKDRIVLSGRFSASDEKYAPILTPLGAGAAQFFINAVETQTRGLDASVNYRNIRLGSGLLNASVRANFTQTEVVGDVQAPDLLKGQEELLFNREEISRIEVASPANKMIASANYNWRGFQLTVQATRFGKVQYVHPSDGNAANWVTNDLTSQIQSRDQIFNAKTLIDLDFAYQPVLNGKTPLTLSLGAQNLLNTYPDQHKHSANISLGRFVYSRRVQQFGVNGRFIYLRTQINL